MKLLNLIAVILFIIFFSGCTTDKTVQKQTDWEKWNLNGKVKSIIDTTFFAVEKFWETVKLDSVKGYSTIKFDQQGFIIEDYGFRALQGYEKVITSRNTQGLKIRTKHFDRNDSLTIKTDYKYDEQERVSEEDTFDNEGELIKKSIYHRQNNSLVEKSEYNSEGKLIETVTSKYNKEGFLIERNNYDEQVKISNDVKYKYDKHGRVIDKVTSTSDGITTRTEYLQYNNANDLSFHRYYIGSLEGDPSEFEAHYQYDEHGNWFKRSVWVGKNETKKAPEGITERKIDYY